MKILLVSCGDVATEAGLRFNASGHHVTAWRRSAHLLPAAFDGHSVDLLQPDTWPQIDPATDIVVFTPVPAARTAADYQRSYYDTAAELCRRLTPLKERLRRFIYISSSAVCGGTSGEWVDENTPTAPASETGVVLEHTEQLLRSSGLPTTILRASGIYGPGRTRLIKLLQDGKAQSSADSHWTNRIHRDDLARAILHVAELGSAAAELYLATDDSPAQLPDVYNFLAAELDLPSPSPRLSATAPHGADRRLDNTKLKDSGFSFLYPSFREGYRSILREESTRHP